MKFFGSISNLGMVTKKEAEVEKDYVKITVLIPVSNKIGIAEFASHYRDMSQFTIEKIQQDMKL